MAAVFGDKILEVLELDDKKLQILYNEAMRQRGIQCQFMARAYNYKSSESFVNRLLKVHGDYTEGFHKQELQGLKGALGWKSTK